MGKVLGRATACTGNRSQASRQLLSMSSEQCPKKLSRKQTESWRYYFQVPEPPRLWKDSLPYVWGRTYVRWENNKRDKDPVIGLRKQPDRFLSLNKTRHVLQDHTEVNSQRCYSSRRQPPAHLKGHVRDQEVKPLGHRQVPLASPKSTHLNPQTRPASHTPLCSPPLRKQ